MIVRSKARRDLLLCVSFFIVTFYFAAQYDFLEWWVDVSRRYEDWELDELLIGAAISVVCIAWFGLRRWHEARALLKEKTALSETLLHEAEQRRSAEARTRAAERLFRSVFDSSPNPIVIVDAEGVIGQINQAGEAIVTEAGLPVVGRPPSEALDSLVGPVVAEQHESVVRSGAAEVREVSAGGDERPQALRIMSYPLASEDGEVGGTCSVVVDLTDRHELETRLRQTQRLQAIGQLTAGVAHHFNNLLGTIQGAAALQLADEGKSSPRLQMILEATSKALAAVRALAAFARQQPLRARRIGVDLMVTRLTDLFRSSISRSIALDVSLEGDLWPIVADDGKVENALLDLVLNARDAMPKGGNLVIRAWNNRLVDPAEAARHQVPVGDYVGISVTDDGTGMSQQVVARAFEPFFTTKEIDQGTGLGLAMVYGFVRQSGGYITLESREEVGTTAAIFLPRAGASA